MVPYRQLAHRQFFGVLSSNSCQQLSHRNQWRSLIQLFWGSSSAIALWATSISGGCTQTTADLPAPPPTYPSGSAIAPTSQTNTSTQNISVPQAPQGQAPISASQSARYLVYVNGDSPYLLQQVRAVEPRAFVQTYQGQKIIQVGQFNEQTNAQKQVTALSARGIQAEMVASNQIATNSNLVRGYWVVIPGSREDLPRLTRWATRLGVDPAAIYPRTAPLGPHLAIGPFNGRSEAEEVDHYLRGKGMDSRVYFNH